MKCDCKWSSPIGKKALMALTGLFLSLFLVMHLSGNLLLYAGAATFDAYCEKMQSLGPLLWVARLGLLSLLVVHLKLAVTLSMENRAARPMKYIHEKTVWASWASRHMALTGIMLLCFIIYHIAHYTLRVTYPEADALASKTEMVVLSFHNPLIVAAYVASMLVLGLHLWHGFSSLWQSLGINHPNYNFIFCKLGPIFAVVISGGFISIPISVMLGIIH